MNDIFLCSVLKLTSYCLIQSYIDHRVFLLIFQYTETDMCIVNTFILLGTTIMSILALLAFLYHKLQYKHLRIISINL